MLEFFHFRFDFAQAFLSVFFGFLCQLSRGKFKLGQTSLHHINFSRYTLEFHGQATGCFVDQVNRFIGKKTIRDVTT